MAKVDLQSFGKPNTTIWKRVQNAVRDAEMRGQTKDLRDVERFLAKIQAILKVGK